MLRERREETKEITEIIKNSRRNPNPPEVRTPVVSPVVGLAGGKRKPLSKASAGLRLPSRSGGSGWG